jgi:cell division transport system permease protein
VNRRDEIVIIKLIGGTDAFVRRPFLYSGFLQGLVGAVVAWVLIAGCLSLLGGPGDEVSRLYGTEFRLVGLPLRDALLVLLCGGLLGWVASRWAVGRHLSRIEPR